MIRVLVVDDHPVVRQGLMAVLEDQEDFVVVGAAASGEEALSLLKEACPDVVLLDLELPGASGIETIGMLRGQIPELKVVIFTAYDTEERVLGALKAGARGYLLKGVASVDIARAIRAVAAGGSHLDPRVAMRVVSHIGGAPHTSLTEREAEVLRLVARGRSNKQIAHGLGITESTVKFHLTEIFTRLSAENRAQAVALAVERGLL